MFTHHLKDRALSAALKGFLNHRFQALGKVSDLRIDTGQHRVELTADLAGETMPIVAWIDYRLETENDALSFVPTGIECSRPWLNLLAKDLLATNPIRIPVPPGIASTMTKLLKI